MVLNSVIAKLDNLENRIRRNNLVFLGTADNDSKESYEASEELIGELRRKSFGKVTHSIQRAHRTGKFTTGKKRPIIVSFSCYEEKMKILRNSTAFRDTQYSVSEDFSKTVRDKRRHLWQYAKAKREDPGNKVYLSFNKLIINGKARLHGTR